MKSPRCIGVAWEFSERGERQQRCYGTYQEDMPDAGFRFNILFVEHNGAFKLHSHEYSELGIVLGGYGRHLTDSGADALEEGDVFVINGMTRHGFDRAHHLKLCNLQYDPEKFLPNHSDLSALTGYQPLFAWQAAVAGASPPPGRLHLSTDEVLHLNSQLATLKTEFEYQPEAWRPMIRATFLQLVAFLCRCHAAQATRCRPQAPMARMERVMAYIRAHFREPLRMDDLARIANLSRSQFQRLFRRTFQVSPQQFILRLRLHEARELLKDADHDVTTVAFETGFCSSSHFSFQFKQVIGEPPSSYRRRVLKDPAPVMTRR